MNFTPEPHEFTQKLNASFNARNQIGNDPN